MILDNNLFHGHACCTFFTMNFSNLKIGGGYRSGSTVKRKVIERIRGFEENKPVTHPPPTKQQLDDAVYVGRYRTSRKVEKSGRTLTRSVKNYKHRYEGIQPEEECDPELVLICRMMHEHSVKCYALPHQVRPSRSSKSPKKDSPRSMEKINGKKSKNSNPELVIYQTIEPKGRRKKDSDKDIPAGDNAGPDSGEGMKEQEFKPTICDAVAPTQFRHDNEPEIYICDAVAPPQFRHDHEPEIYICDAVASPQFRDKNGNLEMEPGKSNGKGMAGCEDRAFASGDEYGDPEVNEYNALLPPEINVVPSSEALESQKMDPVKDSRTSKEFENQNVVSLPSDHAERFGFNNDSSSGDEKTGNRIKSIHSTNSKENGKSLKSDLAAEYSVDPMPRLSRPDSSCWKFGNGMHFGEKPHSSDYETLIGASNSCREHTLMFSDFDDMVEQILSQRPTANLYHHPCGENEDLGEKDEADSSGNNDDRSESINSSSEIELAKVESPNAVHELESEAESSEGSAKSGQTFFSSGYSKHFDASTHSVEHASHTLYSLRTSFLSSNSSRPVCIK